MAKIGTMLCQVPILIVTQGVLFKFCFMEFAVWAVQTPGPCF